MSYVEMTRGRGVSVAESSAEERSTFIRKTYMHLAFAVLAFALLESLFLGPLLPMMMPMLDKMLSGGYSWLVVLGIFMVVGWIADRWAQSDKSPAMQYLGLGLYVLAEALIFLPLLFIATLMTDPNVIPTAGLLTGALFVGLTGTVFITKKDFSFMRGILMVGGFIAIGIIVCSILFGFELGTIFSVAMVGLAGGYILYYTSNVLHHYRPDQHVAASLALFAAVALMFWYILRLVMSFSRD
ncbi:MAG: Bax inhibitor-1/YccA family protein [Deltaproteobacteria bacterium]|nr:Bax inhibitor-1/YccA family protein [Deltaproteobacteria bacterium]MBN2671973.1 Bax inhibitor-1/YccA family protein [Deltaproteobacteria bacterium]